MKKRAGLWVSMVMLLALSALLTACSAGQGQNAPTGADVVQKMRETLRANRTVQGTVELSAKLDKAGIKTLMGSLMPNAPKNHTGVPVPDWTSRLPDLASVTLKVWRESPDKGRVEVDSATLPGMKGVTLVYDGKKVYAYSPKHNKVYTATPTDEGEMAGKMGGMLGDWATMTPEERGDKLLSASDIKVAGSEQVEGKDAYKLEVTPKPGALEKLGLPAMFQMYAGTIVDSAKATVWVDKTRWIPLKATLEHPQIGQFTYTANLELDKPVDAAQFVLQTPPGAETVDLDAMREQMQPKSMTLAQAQDEALKDGWKLLEPSYLPEKATLVEVTRLPGALPGPGSGTWMPYMPIGDYSVPDGKIEVMDSQTAPIFGIKGSGVLTGPAEFPAGSSTYMLKYSSPTTDFSITQIKGLSEKGLGDGYSGINGGDKGMKEVTVRGVKAVAFSPEGSGWTSLHWQDKGGVFVAISGKLSLEETLKIAEGLR